MTNKTIYNLIIISLIFSVVFGVLKINYPSAEKEALSAPKASVISIGMTAGDEAFLLTGKAGASLYDLLLEKKREVLEFSGKNYPGLGFFVTDIGSLHEGGGKHLFYYINNVEASVGVSLYVPKNGDTILWKLR